MTAAWTERQLSNGSILHVSNVNVPLCEDVQCLADFLGADNEARLLQQIADADDKFVKEGFDQRRRVQRFVLDDSDDNGDDENGTIPIRSSLDELRQRLQEATSLHFTHASLEEYGLETFSDSSNQIVTTFASSCQQKDCEKCCMAVIPIRHDAMAHWNRPRKRQAMCWMLESPEHQTNVLLQRGSVYVRSGDNLHFWRSRLAGTDEKPGLFINFYTLGECDGDQEFDPDDTFGYVPSKALIRPSPMPPLQDILTIIVTTSPIKSNPSTELLEKVFERFRFAGDAFCFQCRKIIVCDGCRTKDGSNGGVSRRHQNVKQAMRSGIVTPEQADNYQQFKTNLKELCVNATADSPFCNTEVEELEERHGFAYALRHVMRSLVTTDYVCVIQHDRTFMRSTPIEETIRAMWNNPGIKFVGCSMRSNLFYRDLFYSKYGSAYSADYESMTLRPAELRFDPSLYGCHSESCRQALAANQQLKENLLAVADKYRDSAQCLDQEAWVQSNSLSGLHQMTLSPTLFWYDNIHLAETSHYRDFIFNPSYKMVSRGGFVEEGVLPVLKKTLDRLGLRRGHARFGCYLLDDHSGYFFTGHLDGGNYIPEASRYQTKQIVN